MLDACTARAASGPHERKRSLVDFTCRRPNVLLDSGPSPVSSCHVPSHRRPAREAGGQGGGGDGAIRGRDRFQAWHVGRRPHGRALWQARWHGRGARILFVSSRPRSDGAAREGAAGGGTPVARCINIRRTRRRGLLARATQYRRLVHLGACTSRSHDAIGGGTWQRSGEPRGRFLARRGARRRAAAIAHADRARRRR